MTRYGTIASVRAMLLGGAMLTLPAGVATSQTLVEHSEEARLQLDFHVPDAALRKALPAGWEPMIATAGPAKDANLRLIFIDRVAVTTPDGKPAHPGTNRIAILAAPVRQTATGVTGQMIIGGITADPSDAPGPYGVYLPAATQTVERSYKANSAAPPTGDETWDLRAAGGEHLAVHIRYERAGPTRVSSEVKYFSGADPSVYQLVRLEQGLDIMRNATMNVGDRVRAFDYTASGGRFAALFDGTQKVLSWDSIPWQTRAIYKP